jgi:CRISPR/Cas system-associated exonuclease Cas4 (RecB family)
MEDEFDLPVEYKGKNHIFKASLIVKGFTHRFQIEINGQTILFEPDEERNYRAMLEYGDEESRKNIDIELLKQIVTVIEEIVK